MSVWLKFHLAFPTQAGLPQFPGEETWESCQGHSACPLVSGPDHFGQWEGTTLRWGLPAPMSTRLQRLDHLLLTSILTAVCGSDPTPEGKSNLITVRDWRWGQLPCSGASGWGVPHSPVVAGWWWIQQNSSQGSFLNSLTAPREKGLFLWSKYLGPSWILLSSLGGKVPTQRKRVSEVGGWSSDWVQLSKRRRGSTSSHRKKHRKRQRGKSLSSHFRLSLKSSSTTWFYSANIILCAGHRGSWDTKMNETWSLPIDLGQSVDMGISMER